MRRILILAALASAAALTACAGPGKSAMSAALEPIEAEGYAETAGKDPAAARAPALAAAERAALRKAAALFSGDPAAAEAVLARQSFHIRKSKVLSEKLVEGSLSLKARVWVYMDRVRQAAAPSAPSASGPRLLLSVKGDSGGRGEAAFRNALFSALGASFVAAPAGEDAAALTGRAAASGARAAVSVVFSGRPLEAAVGGGLSQSSVDVSAAVFDARGGAGLGELAVSAAGMGPDGEAAAGKALDEAGASLGRELAARLGPSLRTESKGFILRLYDAPGIEAVSSLVSAVEGISSVSGVRVVSYGGGEAELSVYSAGAGPEEFASAVLRAAGPALVIDGIDAGEVAFRYVR